MKGRQTIYHEITRKHSEFATKKTQGAQSKGMRDMVEGPVDAASVLRSSANLQGKVSALLLASRYRNTKKALA